MRIQRSLGLCVLLLWMGARPLCAVDPERRISQFAHTAWRIQDGAFTGAPYAIAQADGGYLWLGTGDGLFRFDGVRFVRWVAADGTMLPSTVVAHLLGARDGSLWIGTKGGLSHLVNERLVNFADVDHQIDAIIQDRAGVLWATRQGSAPLCKVLDKGLQCYGSADGIPFTHISQEALVADGAGNLWIGSDTSYLRWNPSASTRYSPSGLKGNAGMLGATGFAPDAEGSVWAGTVFPGTGLGLQHLVEGAWKPFITGKFDSSSLEVRTLFMDRHHALWVGTTHQGIFRIFGNTVDHFQDTDGLSGNEVSHFLEDAEGNVWVVTSGGVDKFSDLAVATYSTQEGVTTTEVDAVIATGEGSVWIGGADALNELYGGKLVAVPGLLGKQVTSLHEDARGRLWVGINDTLTIYEKGRFREIKRPDGRPLGMVTDIVEDGENNVWVESHGPPRSLVRVRDEKIQETFHEPMGRLAADPAGNVFIGMKGGNLVRFQDGHAESIGRKQGGDFPIHQMLAGSDGSVVGATEEGLLGWKDGKEQMMTARNGLPCDNVFAVARDNEGDLWLYMKCGLIEVAASEMQEWWERADGVLKVKTFDELNGVRPGAAPFQKSATTPDGRLWFANNVVLQMIDPHRLYENALPPPVHIERVLADRKAYSAVEGLQLPPLTRDLEIDYTALSFVVPQKVKFRYKLEGQDNDWRDPGTRRQAFYNDLHPGTFTFHVIACNNDGVWNDTGARLRFYLAPAWYQTVWFHVVWIACACVLMGLIYRMRVRSIAKAMSARFDERLDERTRMALELHDTFLQTVQGSKMVADDALDPASDQERMRHALERLSVWLGQAVTEGRAALHALRVSTTERNHLAEFLDRTAKEQCERSGISVALTVIGDARELHPIVRDEIARIAEEAIRNACLHSKASQLSMELRYGRDVTLSIRDNGMGMDPEVAEGGRVGHFGLQGMKERSARIRARITITSTLNSGTQMALSVPGDVVYRRERRSLAERLKAIRFWRDGGSI